MENSILSDNLVLYRSKWFAGLTDEAQLSQALLTKPQEISTVVSYIFGKYENTAIDYLTGGIGKTIISENRQYRWPVMIDTDKAIVIRDAKWNGSAIAATDTPGMGLTPIQLWLEDKWFGPGAVITFDDREYQVRIAGAPYQDGSLWVYTCYVADGQPDSFISPAVLQPGCKVSREFSAYEEHSEEADIVNYSTPFMLQNHLTTLRLSYDITGDAVSSVMVIAMKDPKTGKESYLWAPYQEWVAMRQWYQMIERMLVYSKFNANKQGTVDLLGTNGRPVYIGAGLLQQIAPANKRYYTTLTANILEDFLFDLSYNVLGTNERKFVALTGEMGMKELDRVLREKASSYTLVDTKFVTGSGQELTLGGQFTTYKMLNGVVLTLKYFPLYDNTQYNRKLHPVSGKPLESYRFTFIDFTTRDGEPNVVKVVRKDRGFVMWTTAGSVAPGTGHSKSKDVVRSNAKDGYAVHFLGELGIMIKNPTSCGELICDADSSLLS